MLSSEGLSLPPILRTNEQLFVQALMNVQAQLIRGFTAICIGPEQFRISEVYLKVEGNKLRAEKSLLDDPNGLYRASIDVVDFPPRDGARRMSMTHVVLPDKKLYHGTFFTANLSIVSPDWTTDDIRQFLTDIKTAEFDEQTTKEKFKESQNDPEFREVFWNSSQPAPQIA